MPDIFAPLTVNPTEVENFQKNCKIQKVPKISGALQPSASWSLTQQGQRQPLTRVAAETTLSQLESNNALIMSWLQLGGRYNAFFSNDLMCETLQF